MTGIHNTHSLAVGYVMWLFGFFGLHRFYDLFMLNEQVDAINRRFTAPHPPR